ncbi:uncharacterized protein LOC132447908 [Gadus macrocephalus]|uniref:uncharacterized protein LOC132447908 n=1 Tax=Gadus macrocephalus TaxID=80720 RepID=UPI0028CB3DDF|nr:uncharacterized protein LOC132447908 [Gadus macrocephalus]
MLESHLMGSLVLFLLILRTESTNGILNSINDLKKIPFGQSVPKHSLVLLHWFANTIEIDNNDAIELTFEPNNGDYGTHHYGNYERVLDPVPSGNQYFTLGNINHMINNNRNSLPSYVVGDLNHLLGREELNRARIIFSHHILAHTTHQVFITQHYEVNQNRGSGYDPGHTYQITIDLLRELRVLSSDRREQSELSEIGRNFGSAIDSDELSSIRNKFGQLACVGLLLFIVINERNLPCRPNRARETKRPPKRNVGEPKLPPKQNVGEPKLPPKQNVGEPKLPPKQNVGEPKLPPKENIGEPKLPPKQNVGEEQLPLNPNVRVLESPPKRNVQACATPHISVNIPENDFNLRRPNQDWDDDQCCCKCWCAFKICVVIAGLIIAIITTLIIIIIY